MAFSKVKVGGLADDSVTAANVDDDGTGYTVGNLTNSGTLQQTGQVTLGSGGTNWTLPTARGTDKYVLQIGSSGAATWEESLTAPEISSHNFDVSGSTDDGGINAYEAPYELTATLTNSSTTVSAITTTNLKVGQYISGAGIPADTTVSSISSAGSSNNGTIVISNQTASDAANTGVAVKVQKTPGEKNGGKVILTGVNFGAVLADISVAITTSGGGIIANASYISGLSGGTTIIAEWTGTEGTYSTDLTSSYVGKIYFKITKSGLASAVYDSDTTLTSDGSFTALSTSSQTGGDRSATPSATSLGTYGSGRIAGGGQDSNTKLLLNFDRNGGTDIEDSSNTGGDGHKITASGHAVIKASPFRDGKSAMYFDGSGDYLTIAQSSATNADFDFGTSTDYTIEGWYKATTGSYRGILGSYHSGATSGYSLGLVHGSYTTDGSTALSLVLTVNNFTNALLSGGSESAKLEEWIHFALVRSGSTTSMYINGKLADSTTSSIDMSSAHGLRIGSTGANNPNDTMNGYLDEIRIVRGTAVYTSNFTVPTSRLTAITNTKLLIHSNDDFTAIAKTQNSSTSSVGGWSTHGESGGSGNSVAVNGDNLRHTTGSAGAQVWTTRQITGLDQNKKYSASCKIEACSETPHVSLYIGSGDNSTRSSTFGGITGGLGDEAGVQVVGKRVATNSWSPPANGTVYMTVVTNQNLNNTCDINEWRIHNWDDASSSDHTITATRSHHSSAHGGIAPAMAWPANGKTTGSAGVYFDGSGDYLQVFNFSETLSNSWSFELYFNLSEVGRNNGLFYMTDVSGSAGWLRLRVNSSNKLLLYADDNASSWNIANAVEGSAVFSANTWYHLLFVHDTAPSTNTYKIFIDGSTSADISVSSNTNIANTPDELIIGYSEDSSDYLKGYIDSFRWHSSALAAGSSAKPTRIYGAYGQETPDAGTITLTATGEGDFTWSEVAAGTALPGTLAVGSTAHSGSGNSRTHTATITGSFPALTTSLANGTRSEQTTSNILIKAQNDADATKAITLGGSGGYDGIGITQKSTEKPVLFNARRYVGNDLARDISGLGFQPDFVWAKARTAAYQHGIWDSVRGATKHLRADTTQIETTDANGLTEFTSDGFKAGADTGTENINGDQDYISWAWKAGGAPSADGKKMVDGVESNLVSGTDYGVADNNTTPFRNVRQSINTIGGFNITQFQLGDIGTSGSFEGSWFKHGLGSSATDDPDLVILKNMSQLQSWFVWHSGTGAWNSGSGGGKLDTDAAFAGANIGSLFKKTTTSGMPTGDGKVWVDQRAIFAASVNEYFIAYTWKAVAGVSAFGSHTGPISSVSGTTVGANGYCGFKPRWLMIKCTSDAGNWAIFDSFRGEATANQMHYFEAESAAADQNNSTLTVSFTSNGFTTGTHNGVGGGGGRTYISIAYA